MKAITLFLAVSALAAGLIAASYWYRSTLVPIEQTNREAKSVEFVTLGLLRGAINAYQTVAALNNKAALWTACTALLSAASAVAGAWPSLN
jgi:hypothetical protein